MKCQLAIMVGMLCFGSMACQPISMAPLQTQVMATGFAGLTQTAAVKMRTTPEQAGSDSILAGPGHPLSVTIPAATPVPIINIPEVGGSPEIKGDLAWNKPSFASSYWEDGYPACATSGCAWRSASSNGTWFYVDLGEPHRIQYLVTTLFVDSNFSSAPQTIFMVSSDLEQWRSVFVETNLNNASRRGVPRTLTLPEVVTARYVGFYATDWGGGWADLTVFAVLPPAEE